MTRKHGACRKALRQTLSLTGRGGERSERNSEGESAKTRERQEAPTPRAFRASYAIEGKHKHERLAGKQQRQQERNFFLSTQQNLTPPPAFSDILLSAPTNNQQQTRRGLPYQVCAADGDGGSLLGGQEATAV